ncbi:MAG: peptide chain release factor N(5)-glutamine methyltransferase [Burkholderiaceae bacterium]
MPEDRAPNASLPIAAGTSVDAALRLSALDRQEVRILLMHALHLTRSQLITQSDRILTAAEAQLVSQLLQRRIDGEPIAYIVGEREFFGLAFHVTPDVLIPRPETELLVELSLERLRRNACLLDLGTGSGAIAVALAHTRPDIDVTALDQSAAALAVARCNALRHKAKVDFMQSDWYSALSDRRFDVIAANPPYISKHDSHLKQGDLRFEPLSALTDHADGMMALRAIVRGAPDHLKSGGWLLMEHGYDQSAGVHALLVEQGFSEVQSWRDLAGIERVTGGKSPG